MEILQNILTVDPFRCSKEDQFYISSEDFYSSIYVKPKKNLFYKAEKKIKNGNGYIKFFHINGYAGCGKSLFAHYCIHTYSNEEKNYYYEFDRGEGRDYPLDYIVERMTKRFARRICEILDVKKEVFATFVDFGQAIYGSGKVYEMLSSWFYESPWIGRNRQILYDVFYSASNKLAIVTENLKAAYSNCDDVNDKVEFILICDYFWRCAEKIHFNPLSNNFEFCLIDNLDNLQRDAVVDFYLDIHHVIQQLLELKDNSIINAENYIKIIYLFPTREVTTNRIEDGLRKKAKDGYGSKHATDTIFELDKYNVSFDEIITKRSIFWNAQLIDDEDRNLLSHIELLMKIPYVQSTLAALFNGNYFHCVDRILDICVDYPGLISECFNMQFKWKRANNRIIENDVNSCSREGSRGLLLRLLLQLFKSKNIYDSVTDEDKANEFNTNGKLGLSELNLVPSDDKYSVSLSRVLLTFIKESNNHRIRINHIFRCFNDVDGYLLCRYLYALCENTRDTWRRLIVFSNNIPNDIKELYDQFDVYKSSLESGEKVYPEQFSEVEICLSGITYVNTVVTHFEFFLSRVNLRAGLDSYPPLFVDKNIKSMSLEESASTVYLIESVVNAVESCARQVYLFDTNTLDRWVEEGKWQLYERLFVTSPSNTMVKQSHLSRIVFSHVSYLERFRRYILYSINGYKEGPLNDKGSEINKTIVSFIIRYLVLFDKYPLLDKYSSLLNNEKLPHRYKYQIDNKICSKDIINLISEYPLLKKSPSFLNMLWTGYYNQSTAQRALLNAVVEIHNSNYTIIGKIELEDRERR